MGVIKCEKVFAGFLFISTVVGDYVNTMKTTFGFNQAF